MTLTLFFAFLFLFTFSVLLYNTVDETDRNKLVEYLERDNERLSKWRRRYSKYARDHEALRKELYGVLLQYFHNSCKAASETSPERIAIMVMMGGREAVARLSLDIEVERRKRLAKDYDFARACELIGNFLDSWDRSNKRPCTKYLQERNLRLENLRTFIRASQESKQCEEAANAMGQNQAEKPCKR